MLLRFESCIYSDFQMFFMTISCHERNSEEHANGKLNKHNYAMARVNIILQ